MQVGILVKTADCDIQRIFGLPLFHLNFDNNTYKSSYKLKKDIRQILCQKKGKNWFVLSGNHRFKIIK